MVFSKPESEKRESARKSRRWNTTGAAAGNYETSIPKLLNSPSSKNRGISSCLLRKTFGCSKVSLKLTQNPAAAALAQNVKQVANNCLFHYLERTQPNVEGCCRTCRESSPGKSVSIASIALTNSGCAKSPGELRNKPIYIEG